MKQRLRDPEDPLKMVIVCDMWLTGFDAKPVTYLYVDKPMKGHNLNCGKISKIMFNSFQIKQLERNSNES
ncbi:type I restriction enzyme subunit R domain-containing protein [Gottfriedia acidiceleris]|uniref:type I restriction enzyme subunit R domain-containing protein n=1 Tax=Gottfriedia acidiceleris TaxID=371036 RepID=UPI003D1C0D46